MNSLPEQWNVDPFRTFPITKIDLCVSGDDFTALKALVESTFLRKKTRDRRGTTPIFLEVVAAKEVRNAENWLAYEKQRELIRQNVIEIREKSIHDRSLRGEAWFD